MLSLAPSVWFYVCTVPVDMRRSFNGLAISVQQLLGHDPVSGKLFVFFNKRADICKALWWSSGGFCIFAKRLAKGRFKVPREPHHCDSGAAKTAADGQQYVEMDAADLTLIIEGIDIKKARRLPRWNPPKKMKLQEYTKGITG